METVKFLLYFYVKHELIKTIKRVLKICNKHVEMRYTGNRRSLAGILLNRVVYTGCWKQPY